jgi:hypothetical protein
MNALTVQGTNHLWQCDLDENNIVRIHAGCFHGTIHELVTRIYKQDKRLIEKRLKTVRFICNHFHVEIPSPEFYGNGYGEGYGEGNGYGNGNGYGEGYGYGDGEGEGYGYGEGYGDGEGEGEGEGEGYGEGYGDGEGEGY